MIVFDNSVVNQCDAPCSVGVGVDIADSAMGGPSGVTDPAVGSVAGRGKGFF